MAAWITPYPLHMLMDPPPRMQVEGSRAAWSCVMEMLYPVFPRPEITFNRIALMLRILHM